MQLVRFDKELRAKKSEKVVCGRSEKKKVVSTVSTLVHELKKISDKTISNTSIKSTKHQ